MSFLDVSEAPSRKNRGSGASGFLAAPGRLAAPGLLATTGLMVQRKCACGTHTGGGECEDCKRKRLGLKRRDRGQEDPVVRSLASGPFGVAGRPGLEHDFSGLALGAPASGPALRTAPRIQRQPLPGETRETPAAAPAPTPSPSPVPEVTPSPAAAPETSPETSPGLTPEAAPEAATEAPGAAASGRLIADDGATDLQPGQLRQSDFMDQLQTAVCAETEAALAGTEYSATGCPYLAYFFGYYRRQSGEELERTLRRYVPEARGARSASDYIPLVASRVRQGVERWVRTGEVTGVPDGAPRMAAARTAAREREPAVEAGAQPVTPAGAQPAAPAAVQLEARDGKGRRSDDPAAVATALGSGRPLESAVRSRMESAFGRSFAHVRTHTDATASRLSSEQNARAFTVGDHVAFAPSEYRPGTLVGDALIAHELAHVAQQAGASQTDRARSRASADYGALEDDADHAATGVMAALLGRNGKTLGGSDHKAMASLRSGLRLQRCDDNRTPTTGSATGCTTHPVKFKSTQTAKNLDFGMRMKVEWESPTGKLSDLAGCHITENITYSKIKNPPFGRADGKTLPESERTERIPSGAGIPATDGQAVDTHRHPRSLVRTPPSADSYTVTQSYDYKCPACGNRWIPAANYVISYKIYKSGSNWKFLTKKTGHDGPFESDETI